MSCRLLLSVSLILYAGAALSQSAPVTTLPPGSDSWSHAPAAASSAYQAGGEDGYTASNGQASHFKFKQRREARPDRNAALEQSGKAPVMGQMGRDGRPPVDCPRTPMDPACR